MEADKADSARRSIIANGLWLVGGLVMAALNAALSIKTGYSLMGLYLWFIIPVGAIISGFLTGLVYLGIARKLHRRPSRKSPMPLVVALVVLTSSYAFALKFLQLDSGFSAPITVTRVWEFAQASVTNTTYSIRPASGEGSAVGSLGYLLAAVEVIGFVAGGWMALSQLLRLPWSESAGRYLKRTRRKQVKVSESVANGPDVERLKAAIGAGDVESSFALVDQLESEGKKPIIVDLRLYEVAGTGEFLLEGICHVPNGRSSTQVTIGEFRSEPTVDQAVHASFIAS